MENEKKRKPWAGQAKLTEEYQKKVIRRYVLKANQNTDPDIIEHLDSLENVQGYLKELIRRDIVNTKKAGA